MRIISPLLCVLFPHRWTHDGFWRDGEQYPMVQYRPRSKCSRCDLVRRERAEVDTVAQRVSADIRRHAEALESERYRDGGVFSPKRYGPREWPQEVLDQAIEAGRDR